MILGLRRIWGISLINRRRLLLRQTLYDNAWFPVVLIFLIVSFGEAQAQFASRFSLSVGEEYNDNIFFTKQREHDFITNITPTFTFLYQPAGATAPTLNLNISPTAQIFALHPEENNFGDGLNINGGYTFQYSPRLAFQLVDTLQSLGRTRTSTAGGNLINQPPLTPTAPPAPGVPISQTLGNVIPNGRTLSNQFSFQGRYLFTPGITINSGYTNQYSAYLDEGGRDLINEVHVRGTYNWRQEHNLHVGYRFGVYKTRDGENGVVHTFDIGDDYFSNTQIQLTPTLTLAFSTGISLNTGDSGPRVANNTYVNLTKVWERAWFTTGVRKGLTSSFGVSGVSDTIELVTAFNVLLAERFSGNAGVDYSIFDTDDVNFKPFRAYGGLQYAITSWLCSNLTYTHRRLYSGPGGRRTDLRTQGNVYGNSLFLVFTASFDVWPSVRLAQGQGCAVGTPVVAPQFPPSYRQ